MVGTMTTTVKQRPILLSTPMVKARLKGLKTLTRRTKGLEDINTGDPEIFQFSKTCLLPELSDNLYAEFENVLTGAMVYCKCPYGKVGDILWVRETWGEVFWNFFSGILYKADGDLEFEGKFYALDKWSPSIHMPKKHARIYLEITEIRVERLHEITTEDAIAEGIEPIKFMSQKKIETVGQLYRDYLVKQTHLDKGTKPLKSFESLWQSINGMESWQHNPWVWVISFKQIEKPVQL